MAERMFDGFDHPQCKDEGGALGQGRLCAKRLLVTPSGSTPRNTSRLRARRGPGPGAAGAAPKLVR